MRVGINSLLSSICASASDLDRIHKSNSTLHSAILDQLKPSQLLGQVAEFILSSRLCQSLSCCRSSGNHSTEQAISEDNEGFDCRFNGKIQLLAQVGCSPAQFGSLGQAHTSTGLFQILGSARQSLLAETGFLDSDQEGLLLCWLGLRINKVLMLVNSR